MGKKQGTKGNKKQKNECDSPQITERPGKCLFSPDTEAEIKRQQSEAKQRDIEMTKQLNLIDAVERTNAKKLKKQEKKQAKKNHKIELRVLSDNEMEYETSSYHPSVTRNKSDSTRIDEAKQEEDNIANYDKSTRDGCLKQFLENVKKQHLYTESELGYGDAEHVDESLEEEMPESSQKSLGKSVHPLAKSEMLEKHLKAYYELMEAQPKRHTEQQLKNERIRLKEQAMKKHFIKSESTNNQQENSQIEPSPFKNTNQNADNEHASLKKIPYQKQRHGLQSKTVFSVVSSTPPPAPTQNPWTARKTQREAIEKMMPKSAEDEELMVQRTMRISQEMSRQDEIMTSQPDDYCSRFIPYRMTTFRDRRRIEKQSQSKNMSPTIRTGEISLENHPALTSSVWDDEVAWVLEAPSIPKHARRADTLPKKVVKPESKISNSLCQIDTITKSDASDSFQGSLNGLSQAECDSKKGHSHTKGHSVDEQLSKCSENFEIKADLIINNTQQPIEKTDKPAISSKHTNRITENRKWKSPLIVKAENEKKLLFKNIETLAKNVVLSPEMGNSGTNLYSDSTYMNKYLQTVSSSCQNYSKTPSSTFTRITDDLPYVEKLELYSINSEAECNTPIKDVHCASEFDLQEYCDPAMTFSENEVRSRPIPKAWQSNLKRKQKLDVVQRVESFLKELRQSEILNIEDRSSS